MEINRTIIEAAIEGFEQQKQRIDETIVELKAQLNGSTATRKGRVAKVAESAPARKKHKISAAGRRAIAEAQRKRWAAAKKAAPKESAVKATPKKKMSAATRAKLVANLKKAREAKAKKAA